MKDHVFLESSCVSWATLSESIHSRWMVIWFFSTSLVLLFASTFLVFLVATWTHFPKLLSFARILPLALNTRTEKPMRGGLSRGCHAKLQTSRSIWCACEFSMTLLAGKMHGVEQPNRDLYKHSIDLTCLLFVFNPRQIFRAWILLRRDAQARKKDARDHICYISNFEP